MVCSVLTHDGPGLGRGHYFVHNYDALRDVWHLVNDSRPITTTVHGPKTGYMFMYRKVASDSPLHLLNRQVAMDQEPERQQIQEPQELMEASQSQGFSDDEDVPVAAAPKKPTTKYSIRQATIREDRETRLAEMFEHNMMILKKKRLAGYRDLGINESHAESVLCDDNPIIMESKKMIKKLQEEFKMPGVSTAYVTVKYFSS